MADDFHGAAVPLSAADLDAAAAAIGCERAVVDAVCDVESAGSGFLADGRPKILFEAHVFHQLTDGQWDRSHPNISSPEWDRGLYGAAGAHQYDRLAEAIGLDRDSALQSASWGRFQIMGRNYRMVGFADVEAMVDAMCAREAAHLDAFRAFCRQAGLISALKDRDWASFARGYNGPGQVEHYAAALAAAYARHAAAAAPSDGGAAGGDPVLHLLSRGDDVKRLQQLLAAAGFAVDVDGVFGQETKEAVRQFQIGHDITADGVVGSQTWNALKS